ncbi:MAG: helix-turn-helix transcriptional regulator [Pseudomonadota bacterium]
MKDGPDIARIASLIGDPARANMLSALMDGRALTTTELSDIAGVTKSTTSLHLAKLEAGGMVHPQKQGRHRYYALTGAEVASVLEALMGLAQSTGATRARTGPREPALRRARMCYDHLAGEMGVAMLDALVARGTIEIKGPEPVLTQAGKANLSAFGVDIDELSTRRRPLCKLCLDWSVRRPHLAGSVGNALLRRITDLGWAQRMPESRVVTFSPKGEQAFRKVFPAPGR